MELAGLNIGFALTGSYCTFKRVLEALKSLKELNINIIPIMSQNVQTTDTRFGTAEYFINEVEKITGNSVLRTIPEVEPLGPKNLTDALVIAPCTGNTLAKMALGITDTTVTMAAKSTLRNKKPVIVAISTNDGLGNSAKNLGILLNTKNIFFVPFKQDDPIKKNNSLVAVMEKIPDTLEAALLGTQLQPILS